jgi:serine/threonine-protein kinase
VSDPSGRVLGNFVVEREIGRGGMGIVWLARQPSLDRPAVLKKLRRDIGDAPEMQERFDREARAAASVHHENVVAVYDCFRHRGDTYIAQEYVAGVDLHAALARAGPFPPRIAGLIALALARGLEEIHAQGTVHRDLKPRNVLLGRRGEVKITDFGIALAASGKALTQPGLALGSPPYMSPEQMMGERVDARSDLFSLGVLLYEMLAGDTPYPEPREDDTESLLQRMQKERYRRLRRQAKGTPRWLARCVRSCLRGRARRRLASSSALRRELEHHLGCPSPADARSELSSWLWDHQVHEVGDGETVVRVAVPGASRRTRPGSWLLAALACGIAVATLLTVDIRPVPSLPTLAAAVAAMTGDAEGVDAASAPRSGDDAASEPARGPGRGPQSAKR